MLFPSGVEVFNPLSFSYGPFLQYNVLSGASPDGGVPGQIGGYGLPTDNNSGTLTVGGTTASIGTVTLLIGGGVQGFPSVRLNYTIPAGTPGWADVAVNTPNGQNTLPKSLFYAQSVTDYASADKFAAVLYDDKRKQIYLSAGDHIDVFSLNLKQFLSPLTPPAQGATKEFAGLALTTDGSTLLATDLLDGSLAVINPDQPSGAYVIPVAPANTGDPRCSIGPIYVAAASNNQAFIMLGGLPGVGCGPNLGSSYYAVDLVTKQASPAVFPPNCPISGNSIASTRDGTKLALGGTPFAIYDVVKNFCYFGGTFAPGGDIVSGAYISADGNVASSQYAFTDSAANLIGQVGQPGIYYDFFSFPTGSTAPLQQPKLNDAGSLDYFAYPNFFDIVDVRHGLLEMRFSLVETVLNTAVPLAIDSGGRQVYLLTDKGLTIVDLGEAPLSIGWLNPAVSAPGTQIAIRGSGFTTSTTATVGGEPAAVSFIDENTLTLVVPMVPSGPSDIVLTNVNGGAYTLQQAVSVP
jgi:IPT/TIG domain